MQTVNQPDTLKNQIKHATSLVSSRKYEEAITAFTSILKMHPDLDLLYPLLCDLYILVGRTDIPGEWIRRAVRYDDSFSNTFKELAAKLYMEKKFRVHNDILSALVEGHPQDPEAWNNLNVIHSSLNKLPYLKSPLPNFFIIGAAKAGTTSVYNYLKQHPQIYMSPLKEPKYLSAPANIFPHNGPGDLVVDRNIIKSLKDYLSLFSDVSTEKCIGEASADYLYFYNTTIPLIKMINPEAKIIIILRNPVERAFSAYRHLVRDERETLRFEEALDNEKQRKNNNYEFVWFYKEVGFYYLQIKAYLDAFGNENVKVYLFENLIKNPFRIIEDIFDFLDVDRKFNPDISIKYNVSKISKEISLQKFLTEYDSPIKKLFDPLVIKTIGKQEIEGLVHYQFNKIKHVSSLKINPETRSYLVELYKGDILDTQNLIKQDLSDWLK